MKKPKRVLKKSIKKKLILFFIALCLCGFISSIYNTLKWYNDNQKIKEINENLLKKYEPTFSPFENTNTENTTLENTPTKETDIYWKYKDVALIDVDIEALRKENADAIGWLMVGGTNINYPIVQTKDNDYYLKHDFLKRNNMGGWIFMDYENDINNLTENNIIYGHRRFNNTMFGSLKTVLTENWQQNVDNHIIKISTTHYNYLFQIFSIYATRDTKYITTTFSNQKNYQDFLNDILSRSVYNFNTEINEKSKILTLSTCYGENERLAVHAKLIKSAKKTDF